jgi:hypothetical protein
MSGLVGPALNFNKTYAERVAYTHTMDPQYTMMWRRNQSAAQQVAQQQLNQQGFAPTKNNRIDFGGEFPAPIVLETLKNRVQYDTAACQSCHEPKEWSKILGKRAQRSKNECGTQYLNAKKAAPAVANPVAIAKNLAEQVVQAAGAVDQVIPNVLQAPKSRGDESFYGKNQLETRTPEAKTAALSHYALTHADFNGKEKIKSFYDLNRRRCGV